MTGFRISAAVGLAASLAAFTLPLCTPLHAIEPTRISGALAGRVTDIFGTPQMGASVLLFNRFERLMDRVLTNDRGAFLFESIAPETYTVRVNLASFVPALKNNVAVQPGMRSFLAINLNSVLSTVELIYMPPGQTPIMSDEWKWVLRTASATRPVLRILPGIDISDPAAGRRRTSVFSDTNGVLKISAGEGGALSAAGSQADLGTAFALATSLFGAHHLEFSGNVGYGSNAGIPTAGFRTSFGGQSASNGPRVNVTMRQIYLPARVGSALATGSGNIPALQNMAVSFTDRRQLGDDVSLEYGSSLESVSFLERLNYFSPFARLRWGLIENGALELAYSSGAPATELLNPGEVSGTELSHQLSTLAIFPRVSLRAGRVQVQRVENFEIGYRRAFGNRTVSAGVYRESVSGAAMMMASPAGFYSTSELLPDLASNSSIFNAGKFDRMGYSAAVTQNLADHLNVGVAFGYGGALASRLSTLATNNPDELRSLLHRAQRHSITVRATGIAPLTGTHYTTSYQFTDYDVLQPVHLSLTHRTTLEPGLNVGMRQPIPGIAGLFTGRLEATAELRNLLAQGYLPMHTADGRRLLLIQSPRAVRGGLSFIF
ncbi:MAG: TonB-dependent receptor [Acidobacteriia bacterium]|nr:TonB-dependent receptor [Terriglobia bacterium]